MKRRPTKNQEHIFIKAAILPCQVTGGNPTTRPARPRRKCYVLNEQLRPAGSDCTPEQREALTIPICRVAQIYAARKDHKFDDMCVTVSMAGPWRLPRGWTRLPT